LVNRLKIGHGIIVSGRET